MSTVDERLKHVTLKVKRAKEHVADAERQVRAFLDSQPYAVGTKHDPETRKLVYYVTSAKSPPECLPLITGDAVQNLRSALDHLAYQLVCSDTGDKPPRPHKIYFPIAENPEEYQSLKGRKMEGARQETFNAVDLIKPYRGGTDDLWVLSKLNNIDKHRLLLMVGSQAGGIHLGQLVAHAFRASAFSEQVLTAIETMDIALVPADKGFPLKEGFELLICGVDEEPNPTQQFTFDLAFSEPGIAEGKPLLQTLHQLTNLVEGIVTALTPRLNAS